MGMHATDVEALRNAMNAFRGFLGTRHHRVGCGSAQMLFSVEYSPAGWSWLTNFRAGTVPVHDRRQTLTYPHAVLLTDAKLFDVSRLCTTASSALANYLRPLRREPNDNACGIDFPTCNVIDDGVIAGGMILEYWNAPSH